MAANMYRVGGKVRGCVQRHGTHGEVFYGGLATVNRCFLTPPFKMI